MVKMTNALTLFSEISHYFTACHIYNSIQSARDSEQQTGLLRYFKKRAVVFISEFSSEMDALPSRLAIK